MSIDTIRVTFEDDTAQESCNAWYVDGSTLDSDLNTAASLIQTISINTVQQLRRDYIVNGPTIVLGGTAAYSSHNDMLTIEVYSTTGEVIPITTSGPDKGVFEADFKTLNVLNTNVAALITWILAHVVSKTGNAAVQYKSGHKWMMATE